MRDRPRHCSIKSRTGCIIGRSCASYSVIRSNEWWNFPSLLLCCRKSIRRQDKEVGGKVREQKLEEEAAARALAGQPRSSSGQFKLILDPPAKVR